MGGAHGSCFQNFEKWGGLTALWILFPEGAHSNGRQNIRVGNLSDSQVPSLSLGEDISKIASSKGAPSEKTSVRLSFDVANVPNR